MGLAVTAPDSRTVKVTWNPPPQSDINGIIKYYLVQITIAETLETLEYKSNKTVFVLNNAHPYYTYSVKVSAVTVAPGPYTSEYSITTPQDGIIINLLKIFH